MDPLAVFFWAVATPAGCVLFPPLRHVTAGGRFLWSLGQLFILEPVILCLGFCRMIFCLAFVSVFTHDAYIDASVSPRLFLIFSVIEIRGSRLSGRLEGRARGQALDSSTESLSCIMSGSLQATSVDVEFKELASNLPLYPPSILEFEPLSRLNLTCRWRHYPSYPPPPSPTYKLQLRLPSALSQWAGGHIWPRKNIPGAASPSTHSKCYSLPTQSHRPLPIAIPTTSLLLLSANRLEATDHDISKRDRR